MRGSRHRAPQQQHRSGVAGKGEGQGEGGLHGCMAAQAPQHRTPSRETLQRAEVMLGM
jgi:hypothetical protein